MSGALARLAPTRGTRGASAPSDIWGMGIQAYWQTQGATQPGNYSAMVAAYYSWCYAAASAIAADMSAIEWRLYTETPEGRAYLLKHPFLDIIDQPNPHFSWPWMVSFADMSLELTGNGYWFKNRDKLGVVRELWPLLPDLVRVVPDEQEFIRGYLYGQGANKVAIERRNVVHLRYPNPRNLYYGMGVVEAARHSIDINELMKQYDIALLNNRGVVGGVIEGDGTLPLDERRRLRAEWEDRHSGANNAGKLAVLVKGFKYKPISMSPADLQYLEQKKATRDETFAMFGVPRSKVGMADDVNRANAEAADYTMGRNVTLPRVRLMAADLQMQLIREYDKRLRLEHSSPIPVNEPHKLKQATDGVKFGVLKVNEGRQMIGVQPDPGGDVFLWPVNVNATEGGPQEGKVGDPGGDSGVPDHSHEDGVPDHSHGREIAEHSHDSVPAHSHAGSGYSSLR